MLARLFQRNAAPQGIPPHVHKWAMDAGQYLGRAFVGQGIGTRLEARRIGPHVVLFEFVPVPPTPESYRKLKNMKATVKATLQVDRCRIAEDRGRVVIRVPNPYAAPLDPLAFEGGAGLLVPVGLSDAGGVDVVDFERTPHVGIFGPTNAGKTTIARMLVLHLARQNAPAHLRVFVIGAHAHEWQAIEGLAHSWGFVYHEDAAQALEWLVSESDRRRKVGANIPRIVALVDDAAELIRRYPAVGAHLGDLATTARHAGIHLIIISQRAVKAGGGDTMALANLPRRLVVGSATATEAAISAGRADTGAHELGLGEALSVGGPKGTVVVAVPNVPPDLLYSVAGGVRSRAPWERDETLAAPPLMQTPIEPAGNVLPFRGWPAVRNGRETGETARNGETGTPLESASIAVNQGVMPGETGNGKRERVREMVLQKMSQGAILTEVWGVKPGGGSAYKDATEELRGILADLMGGSV